MNGFMLLVLLALAGQVGQVGQPNQLGQALPPSLPTGQALGQISDGPEQRDYGWQINQQTGSLEYIVQISPDKANFMLSNGKEFESIIPPEVAARVKKIVVTIGTDPIISTPMSEVLKLPPVTTAVLANNISQEVGNGRFAQLESGQPRDLMNVSGGDSPPPLATGGLSDLANAGRSLADDVANTLRQPENLLAQSGAGSFLSDARGGASPAPGSKFSNTAPPPTAAPTTAAPTTAAPLPTAPLGGIGLNGTAANPSSVLATPPIANNFPNSTAAGQMNASGSNLGAGNSAMPPRGAATGNIYTAPTVQAPPAGYGQPTGYPPASGNTYVSTPGYSAAPTATGTFGAAPLGSVQPSPYSNPAGQISSSAPGIYANNPYASPDYATAGGYPTGSSPYLADPPSVVQPFTRIADARNNLPTTSNSSPVQGTGVANSSFANTQNQGTGMNAATNNGATNTNPTGNLNNGLDNQPLGRSGMENVVPVMFVLSLVVNFYLGMLIRKLLGRYRSLLASIRSQTI
ncbi:MAG: hypothetical protein IT423_22190 [Pirellulaceae bacterium]|nr:hypothetical protein [Pirellulaceae bacterium]